jgi:hypothetical protein
MIKSQTKGRAVQSGERGLRRSCPEEASRRPPPRRRPTGKTRLIMTEMSVHRIKSIRINEQEYVSFKTITVTATDTGGNEVEFTMYTNDMQLTTGANHE